MKPAESIKEENHVPPFDYTEWRNAYFDSMTPEELDREILEYARTHPFQGKTAEKLVLAWDPDYVKCTPEEEAAIDQAAREMENGEYVLHDAINWD